MVYLDSSVALAHLLGEDRSPPNSFWFEQISSSHLLEYEIMNRIHAYGLTHSHTEEARALIAGIGLVDLAPEILTRALEPFPMPVRTLDGLHLATIEFMRSHGQTVELASYDERLLAGARSLGIPLYPI